jgi:hypothetical protein
MADDPFSDILKLVNAETVVSGASPPKVHGIG